MHYLTLNNFNSNFAHRAEQHLNHNRDTFPKPTGDRRCREKCHGVKISQRQAVNMKAGFRVKGSFENADSRCCYPHEEDLTTDISGKARRSRSETYFLPLNY